MVFFSLYTGLPATRIGLGFSYAGLLGLVGSLPAGHLADRFGGRRVWLAGVLVTATGFGVYPLASGFRSFLLVMAVATVGQLLAGSGQGLYAVAALPADGRVRVLSFVRACKNVGFTVGSGLGTAVLALDSRVALLALVPANSVGMLVNAAHVARMPVAHATGPAGHRPRPRPWSVLRDRLYLALAALFAACAFAVGPAMTAATRSPRYGGRTGQEVETTPAK
ncbi:MFS transporter [Streptomyces sp. SL13]|uniref:MFS transporter n=1 Tax=Streptantibioticus silvisoli TaxID=2705255 RepID=A0AA90KFV8_9ACTN|nr:MFS transporter [Streptantibioticus silvisoli]MDI5969750.1 MFS transporter [Streptantibioticus silvisoli]